jgi:hypothetical protein
MVTADIFIGAGVTCIKALLDHFQGARHGHPAAAAQGCQAELLALTLKGVD